MSSFNCELNCFPKCAIPISNLPTANSDTASLDSANASEALHKMAKCMYDVCEMNFLENTTSELSGMYQNWASSMNKTMGPENCTTHRPWCLANENDPRYAVPILGYLSPILVFLTIINNSLVCIVLLKRHMRSPTNTILVAMAISDMLTGLFPTPIFLHFHATQRFFEWIPYNWCYAINMFSINIPTVFHTASIWLTMALAIQRYIYVCHSFKARTWCTIRNVIYGTIAIYFFATLTHCTRFFETYNVETVVPSLLNADEYVSACTMQHISFLRDHLDVYYNIYYWFRVFFINLMPCVSLVVMNALLIYAMRMARIRRMQLLRQNKNSESRKLKESNCTTLMLVAVVGLFLLVEFPLALLIICVIFDQSFNIVIIEKDTLSVLSLFSNFFILLSYPLNFFIYCGMSKQFRETFKRLFTGNTTPLEKEYSQYATLPTENGKTTAVTGAMGDETAL